jgi:nicotinamide mononucleotide transporter
VLDTFNYFHLLELVSAVCSIVYSVLLIREQKVGWLFGILASVAGMVLFAHSKLYAQSVISIYYAGIGVYGWVYWSRAEKRNEHIHNWRLKYHAWAILLCVGLSILCSWVFITYTDSSSPLFDSVVTVFGLLASIKEARKILTSWVYWFFINIASGILYYQQQLYIYAALMLVYALICIPGYINWFRIYRHHRTT